MISQEKIARNWHSVVGKVKEKFNQISNEDLSSIQGNFDQLIGLIERKAGQSREQAEAFLSSVYSSAEGTIHNLSEKGQQAYSQATEMLDDGMKKVSQKAGEGYEYARETVARRPAESLFVMAGLGVLAGIAIGISWRSKR